MYLLALDADPTATTVWEMQEAMVPEPAPATISSAQQLSFRTEAGIILPTLRAGAHLQRGRGWHQSGRNTSAAFKDKGTTALWRAAERWALLLGP